MRTLSADLLSHLAQEVTTLAEGWLVMRQDGERFGWVTHDRDVTIDGVLYRATEGLKPTSAHTTNQLNVDTLDVTAFLDVSTEAEIAAGIWDDATVTHFELNWAQPPTALDDSVLVKRYGNLGRITRQEGLFTAEIRGIADRLQTRIGRQYSPVCPWRHAVWNGATFVPSIECQADLAGLGFIVDGTITDVGTDATLTFGDSASAQAEGFYNDGFIAMTSGANAGRWQKVRLWAGMLFELYIPFAYPVEVGDTYRAVRGDDHTFTTCKDTFDNVVNFGGFPHIPGQDNVYKVPAGLG